MKKGSGKGKKEDEEIAMMWTDFIFLRNKGNFGTTKGKAIVSCIDDIQRHKVEIQQIEREQEAWPHEVKQTGGGYSHEEHQYRVSTESHSQKTQLQQLMMQLHAKNYGQRNWMSPAQKEQDDSSKKCKMNVEWVIKVRQELNGIPDNVHCRIENFIV
ncbi:uncharacterized protein BT62DRAFT_923231 [Guyanagaster necrorhizus]|uniref:Uncharacterized protein n=1 Tax=Guyanagaster necrorhizus TaxID=856835 RepID=A0A9P8ANB6_9AGAR|nr:uncharacterized protein BT62DRAFT_923231 [Guyanagaster necrorhizus MCA 3950]KAG7441649.1 hypothetical protein BT62DRAFT_923231 [Guyanagaster necrorhizus MCA 3950]